MVSPLLFKTMNYAISKPETCKRIAEDLVITERTSKMDTKRFSEYVDDIKRWAAEYGCYIPAAGEVKL